MESGRGLNALVTEKVMGKSIEWRPWDLKPYSTDIATARLVEDEIERRGLGWEYAQELLRLVAYPDGRNVYDRTPRPGNFYQEGQPTDKDLWHLLRATPAQRCLAALKAVGYDYEKSAAHPSEI